MQDKKRFCNICTLKSVLSLLDNPTYLKEKSTAQGIKIIKLIVPSSLTSTCSFMTNPSTDFCCFLTGKAIIEGILQKGAYNCHTVDHISDKKKLKKSFTCMEMEISTRPLAHASVKMSWASPNCTFFAAHFLKSLAQCHNYVSNPVVSVVIYVNPYFGTEG